MTALSLVEKFTFDFGKARTLAENDHYLAFEELFGRFVQTLKLWCPAETSVVLMVKINVEGLSENMSLDTLFSRTASHAHQLYYSDNDDFALSLHFGNKQIGIAHVVMDPILFYLSSCEVDELV